MTKLTQIPTGGVGRITAMEGDARFYSRIASIGLTIGCRVEVLRNEKLQPLLLYGRDSMIALNREESEKILMEVTA